MGIRSTEDFVLLGITARNQQLVDDLCHVISGIAPTDSATQIELDKTWASLLVLDCEEQSEIFNLHVEHLIEFLAVREINQAKIDNWLEQVLTKPTKSTNSRQKGARSSA